MVEGGGLENRYILTGIEGSNPSLSAIPCPKYPQKFHLGFSSPPGFFVLANPALYDVLRPSVQERLQESGGVIRQAVPG